MEVQQVADHCLDAVNAGVAEFHYFMAFGTDDVVVLAVAVAFLVLGKVAAKLVLADKALLDKQIQGVVDGGAADLQAALLHAGVELFDIEVAGAGINLFENGVALGRFAQAFVFEVGGEELFDFFELISIQRGLGGGAGGVLGSVAGFGRAAGALARRIGGRDRDEWNGLGFTHCMCRM